MKPSLRFAVTHVIPARNEDVWRVLEDFGAEHGRPVRHCVEPMVDGHHGQRLTRHVLRELEVFLRSR
jgi:hypothetical protein